ncbi:MAG: AbrB/MazE/SpoVT family DNA-binding domain-containing protein [Thermoproteus sp. AZ2]|uniref:AbrB/MazE/SpoVT family DNA-binding domain-containing protein n=1 Tax=Thermoproteus sp. AZ2 TaxID=1609232 RepID=A0ACC6V037_9CREN|nr:MAG: transcriptional regulator [Thermoproteus sp. AZ2]
MEARKIFRIRESFAIFLPKRWCEANSLDEKSEVELYWDEDTVVVKPRRGRQFSVRLSSPNPDVAAKLLMSAFVTGYDEIRLEVKGMGLEVRNKVIAFARGLYMLPLEEGPDYIVFRVEDVKFDREKLIERMGTTLEFMLDHLATAPRANPSLLESVDDEVDRYRHMIERLCYKYPTSSCVRHVQLARYIERAADHVVELAKLEPPRELVLLLKEAATEFARASSSGELKSALAFLETIDRARFLAQQRAGDEVVLIHADRVLDYLANAIEVYMDMAACRTPNLEI